MKLGRRPKTARRKRSRCGTVGDVNPHELWMQAEVARAADVLYELLTSWESDHDAFWRTHPGRVWTRFGAEIRPEDIMNVTRHPLRQAIEQVIELAVARLVGEGRIEITRVGDRVFMRPIPPPPLTNTEGKIIKYLREIAPNCATAKKLAKIADVTLSHAWKLLGPRAPLRRHYGVQNRCRRGYFVKPD